VAGKQVRVEYDKRDRYGRIVGTVWVRAPEARCSKEPCRKTLDAGSNVKRQYGDQFHHPEEAKNELWFVVCYDNAEEIFEREYSCPYPQLGTTRN
jgi:hypothetical protein